MAEKSKLVELSGVPLSFLLTECQRYSLLLSTIVWDITKNSCVE